MSRAPDSAPAAIRLDDWARDTEVLLGNGPRQTESEIDPLEIRASRFRKQNLSLDILQVMSASNDCKSALRSASSRKGKTTLVPAGLKKTLTDRASPSRSLGNLAIGTETEASIIK